jgi:hypothetical protein
MDPLTPYIIIACCFGAFATIVFLAGRATGWGDSFPGRFYTPLMLIAALFAIASLTSVIAGAEQEKKDKAAEKAAEAAGEAHSGAE